MKLMFAKSEGECSPPLSHAAERYSMESLSPHGTLAHDCSLRVRAMSPVDELKTEKTLKDSSGQTTAIGSNDKAGACESKANSDKPVYKKPQLRKYTQVDYVTAYGVD